MDLKALFLYFFDDLDCFRSQVRMRIDIENLNKVEKYHLNVLINS